MVHLSSRALFICLISWSCQTREMVFLQLEHDLSPQRRLSGALPEKWFALPGKMVHLHPENGSFASGKMVHLTPEKWYDHLNLIKAENGLWSLCPNHLYHQLGENDLSLQPADAPEWRVHLIDLNRCSTCCARSFSCGVTWVTQLSLTANRQLH